MARVQLQHLGAELHNVVERAPSFLCRRLCPQIFKNKESMSSRIFHRLNMFENISVAAYFRVYLLRGGGETKVKSFDCKTTNSFC